MTMWGLVSQSWSWFTAVIAVSLCLYFYFHRRTIYNLPPGPSGWPILGILPSIIASLKTGIHLHDFMTNLSIKYGPVFSCKFAGKRIVVLNDFDSIREAFGSPNIINRVNSITKTFEYFNRAGTPLPHPGGEGIFFAGSINVWQENRKLIICHFRKFSQLQMSFETLISTEAQFLADAMDQQYGKSFNPKRILSNATANIISAVAFGKRYDYEDKEFVGLLKSFDIRVKLLSGSGIMFLLPKVISMILMLKEMDDFNGSTLYLRKMMSKIIDSHISRGVDPENIRDIIDAYLIEMSNKDETYLKSARFDVANLLSNMIDLFGAGMETSSNTLLWGLLYMVEYPDVQKRLQHDIDEVIGQDRLPTESDRSKLPFVESTILEILRIQCIVPLVGLRIASCDTSIQMYDIPEGTIVFANLWRVLHDPNLWEEPEQFRPDRFLDKSGKLAVPQYMIPFSSGRRECLGKKIATSELFIFFAHLLQKFKFTIPDGHPRPSFTGDSGLTYSPNPFEICALPR